MVVKQDVNPWEGDHIKKILFPLLRGNIHTLEINDMLFLTLITDRVTSSSTHPTYSSR